MLTKPPKFYPIASRTNLFQYFFFLFFQKGNKTSHWRNEKRLNWKTTKIIQRKLSWKNKSIPIQTNVLSRISGRMLEQRTPWRSIEWADPSNHPCESLIVKNPLILFKLNLQENSFNHIGHNSLRFSYQRQTNQNLNNIFFGWTVKDPPKMKRAA